MLSQLPNCLRRWREYFVVKPPTLPLGKQRPTVSQLARLPLEELPKLVRESAAAMKYLELLGGLDWSTFPERSSERAWPGHKPAPHAPFCAALLVKADKGFKSMAKLREYLVEQPVLTWLLGFPLQPSPTNPLAFDLSQSSVDASLPTHRHWNRLLREMPRAQVEFLLRSSVQQVNAELPTELGFGDEISLDTKHIIAWVKENNPKEFIKGGRFHKEKQPTGDKDCKVGFKANDNQPKTTKPAQAVESPPATPANQGIPASQLSLDSANHADGNYYWGYASGVVATKVGNAETPIHGEFVLAEWTQTLEHGDPSYFLPLMAQTERNLGRKPKRGALDAAFDAFYTHEYFAPTEQEPDRFAAIPWADRADHKKLFTPEGLPLCAAGLAMPLRNKVQKQSGSLVPHEIGRFVCPLLFPEKTGDVCPIHHPNWLRTGKEQGCISTLPTSIGNRMRHQLDRSSDAYKALYKQRTAVERINSQALELGIERPKLRNHRSIANHNTLLYVLINLRGLLRLKEQKAALVQRKE